MRIAGVAFAAYRTAVHRGHYSCAPDGRFDGPDLGGLWAFGRLTAMGLTGPHAGPAACQVANALRHEPERASLTVGEPETGVTLAIDLRTLKATILDAMQKKG